MVPLNAAIILSQCVAGRTCEGVMLYGKRDFGDITIQGSLRWKNILNYAGGPNIIIKVLIKWMQGVRVREGYTMTGTGVRMMKLV